jgi:hypothetical protein
VGTLWGTCGDTRGASGGSKPVGVIITVTRNIGQKIVRPLRLARPRPIPPVGALALALAAGRPRPAVPPGGSPKGTMGTTQAPCGAIPLIPLGFAADYISSWCPIGALWGSMVP